MMTCLYYISYDLSFLYTWSYFVMHIHVLYIPTIKEEFSFNNGSYHFKNLIFSACKCEGKDNRIPLLKEVFEAFPETPINIDIKVNNNVLIKKVR